ncbi:MAG: DUF371 domain-containing protein, partial [Candidatus Geothermarchaeales archaeon]
PGAAHAGVRLRPSRGSVRLVASDSPAGLTVATVSDIVSALGHPNTQATHTTTLEVTRERGVTRRGDCIVAVAAEKACSSLAPDLRRALMTDGSRVEVRISCGGEEDVVVAEGSRRLTLSSRVSIVVRRSGYVCDRTLAVRADKAAADLSRALIEQVARGLPVSVVIAVTGDEDG